MDPWKEYELYLVARDYIGGIMVGAVGMWCCFLIVALCSLLLSGCPIRVDPPPPSSCLE